MFKIQCEEASLQLWIRQLECQVGLTILLLKPGGRGSLFVEFRVR